MQNHYPLLLTPIYKEMLWGGNRLNTIYNRTSPYEKTGESWDVSCRPGEVSIITNGPAAGQTLADYIAQDKAGVLGSRLANQKRFPLLVKLIDANENLSVQVHPDDNYARIAAAQGQVSDTGKAEIWYILTPPTDGHLIIGLKQGITADALRNAYKTGTAEDCLSRLPVKTGDIVSIPAGLVHSLTPGVMVAEIQQNSDITYRLYDYNRIGLDGKPRDLHIEEALAVTDFEGKIPKAVIQGLPIKKGDCTLTYAIANPYFAVIKYDLQDSIAENSNPAAFCIFTCVEGDAEILTNISNGLAPVIPLPAGRSVFIPASLGRYTLRPKHGHCMLLKSFVPDIENDFLAPLMAYGYTREDIAASTAVTIK